jgi:AcrR family transcriptional regulator
VKRKRKPPLEGAAVRKRPSQDRSRKRVDQILAAVRTILERDGHEAVTTSRIAEEAGVPISSIYQYFTNKEEILAYLLNAWLTRVHEVMDRVEEAYYLKADWRAFFDQLGTTMNTDASIQTDSPDQSALVIEAELTRATLRSQRLSKVEQQHRNAIAHRLAGYLKGYGSKLPQQQLIELSLLIYDLGGTFDLHEAHKSPAALERLENYRRIVTTALAGHCLSDA